MLFTLSLYHITDIFHADKLHLYAVFEVCSQTVYILESYIVASSAFAFLLATTVLKEQYIC